MNLAVNARDAMLRGGVLTIRMRVGESRSGRDRVIMEVSDTGEGIPSEVAHQIFEPFFTTKGLGRGTGLGLATVQGIVEQSGGSIHVRSRPGVGSVFTVDLPRVDARPDPDREQSVEVESARAGETILLVEDEDPVRMVVSRLLQRHGYRVIEATSGSEAAQILHRSEPIDLLLTDVVLPGITGVELVELGRKLRPGLRVLMTSGHSEEDLSRSGSLTEIPLLSKPFEPAQLLLAVRAAIDADATGWSVGHPRRSS